MQASVGTKQVALTTRGGDVFVWGLQPDGETTEIPTKVEGLEGSRCKQVVCMHTACMALTERGSIVTWGTGSTGVLGHGSSQAAYTPKTVRDFVLLGGDITSGANVSIRQISAGPSHCAAVSQGLPCSYPSLHVRMQASMPF